MLDTAPQASSKVSAAHLRRGAYLYLLTELRDAAAAQKAERPQPGAATLTGMS